MKKLIAEFKAMAWDDRLKWFLIGAVGLAVISSFFVGDAEAKVDLQPEKYVMEPNVLPPVVPFDMRWPDTNFYFSCVPMDPRGIFACRFIPNEQ